MKILHSADWHLGAALQGRTPDQTALLKAALLDLPRKIVEVARAEQVDLMLLAGDLFDGSCTAESLRIVQQALASAKIPVVIAPGNHDFYSAVSPWDDGNWPGNVYIFKNAAIESIVIPSLDCRIYGAAFQGPVCEPLLEGFRADGPERYAIGLLHGDPTTGTSEYCAVSKAQVTESGLNYLALGHIHKAGSFRAGETLCLWPGCPMGRGFDELGSCGVAITTLEDGCESRFVPLDVPRFYRMTVPVQGDVLASLERVLPAVGSDDFYRITLTGESDPVDVAKIYRALHRFPNLELEDCTLPPMDLWAGAGTDTLEGVFFGKLREVLDSGKENPATVELAARISRLLLSNQEVPLP